MAAYPNLSRSPEEALARQFADWERRGRGWQVWPCPVRPEPPFRPFFGHYQSAHVMVDDGRRPSLLGGLLNRITGWLEAAAGRAALPAPAEQDEEDEPLPEVLPDAEPLVELQLTLPGGFKSSRELTEEFLIGLAQASRPLAFELVGRAGDVVVQLVCAASDRAGLARQLSAYFPDAYLTEETDFLARAWQAAGGAEPVIVEFGLAEEFMRPLRTVRTFDHDPLIGLSGALAGLEEDEIGLLQVLFEPVRNPWSESIFRAVTDAEGKPFFLDAPALVAQAKEKIARPLYAAVVRIGARSFEADRAWEIAQRLGGALGVLASPGGNDLAPLTNDDYDEEDHEQDLLARQSRRSGMLLNSDELISLVHLPGAAVRTPELRRERRKTKAAPALAAGRPFVLGENAHSGRNTPVTLSPEQRHRHMHVIGASGTGKSTFLLNMILQDIEHGEGLAVLDPHGDLIDAILARVPEERWGDVVLLDPSDEEYPVGFNILSAHSELEKQLIASDLTSVFRRLSTSWGDQMNSVLGNAILAFLESERGGTLADLRRFLVEKDFREEFLETVRDSEVVYYWRKEFPLLTGKPQGPLLTRLDIFLRPKLIRHMVVQKENKLDFARIMNTGQIVLAKLSQGAIGEENAYLLGSLLVSKFHQLALSRQETAESRRRDFYLYIDEFHNFVTPSMASILSGARKYHLGLILAHQEMRQIGRDSEVAAAVLANPYARVCFRLGDEDARKLEGGFAFFEARDLQNLGTGEALCRLERADYDFNLKTYPLEEVDEARAAERLERIVQLSRQRYAVHRDLVQAELERERQTSGSTEIPGPSPTPKPARSIPPESSSIKKAENSAAALPQSEAPLPTHSESTVESSISLSESKPRKQVRAKSQTAEPSEQGRGGRQHKYIQQLIKHLAEDMGWRAEIEKQILEGAGSVDVVLSKGKVTVACEISVTTGVEQEVGNIEKCLKAGFTYVVAVSQEDKQVDKLKATTARRLGEGLDKVRFLTPKTISSFIQSLEPQAAACESAVRGWKVKLNYSSVEAESESAKKRTVSQVITQSIKKMKK